MVVVVVKQIFNFQPNIQWTELVQTILHSELFILIGLSGLRKSSDLNIKLK